MAVRNEVEGYITSNWQDKKVAKWVIDCLPLLEKGFTYPVCPVFTLSFNHGLEQKDGTMLEDFPKTPKIVMSGGFEGNSGHMCAVSEMLEVRALTADAKTSLVLMLEPDSYIIQQKKRNPIVNINQREQLWSTSGLVDVVILLPEKEGDMSVEEHYIWIHRAISPAVWCANVENPYWLEIITRMQETEPIDIIRLFKHEPELHTSFLYSTRSLSVEEVKAALFQYILKLTKDTESYQVSPILTSEQAALIFSRRLVRGL